MSQKLIAYGYNNDPPFFPLSLMLKPEAWHSNKDDQVLCCNLGGRITWRIRVSLSKRADSLFKVDQGHMNISLECLHFFSTSIAEAIKVILVISYQSRIRWPVIIANKCFFILKLKKKVFTVVKNTETKTKRGTKNEAEKNKYSKKNDICLGHISLTLTCLT